MQAFEFLAPIEAKFATRTGELTGYGSTFGNVDLGGDIVAPGAFTKSISEHEAAIRCRACSGRMIRLSRSACG